MSVGTGWLGRSAVLDVEADGAADAWGFRFVDATASSAVVAVVAEDDVVVVLVSSCSTRWSSRIEALLWADVCFVSMSLGWSMSMGETREGSGSGHSALYSCFVVWRKIY